MKSFKEQAIDDLNIFIDLDMFGEIHFVEGIEIPIILDDDQLTKLKGGQEMAIGESSVLLIAKSIDLPKRKGNGSALNLDGKEYIIDDWQENVGISIIALSQNVSL